MIDPELLKILVCPACKTALEYRKKDSALFCERCRRLYAVEGDIPNLLVAQARIVS